MCLIICHKSGSVPTVEMLRQGRQSNSDGIGLAWKYLGEVYFRKGIGFEELVSRVTWIGRNKVPYIVHFRIATSGARVPELCHPFPLVTKTDLLFRLHGKAKSVMAHNGTWSGWREAVENKEFAAQIEANRWSDSAVMAWLLSQRKKINLSQIGYGHRVAILSTKRGLDLYGNFSTDPKTGIHYSNRSWSYGSYSSKRGTNYSYPYGMDDDDLEYMDPCSIPVKSVDEVIAENTKLLTHQTQTPAQPPKRSDTWIARSTQSAGSSKFLPKGDIISSDGKRFRFSNDGGWRPVDEEDDAELARMLEGRGDIDGR